MISSKCTLIKAIIVIVISVPRKWFSRLMRIRSFSLHLTATWLIVSVWRYALSPLVLLGSSTLLIVIIITVALSITLILHLNCNRCFSLRFSSIVTLWCTLILIHSRWATWNRCFDSLHVKLSLQFVEPIGCILLSLNIMSNITIDCSFLHFLFKIHQRECLFRLAGLLHLDLCSNQIV